MSEDPRVSFEEFPPKPIQALVAFATSLGIDQRLRELINVRISQINGCGVCVDMHAAMLEKQGVPARHVYALSGWRAAHRFFSATERAALAWVEAVNAIPNASPGDAEFQELRKHFNSTQIAEITLLAGVIRTFNALNVSVQTQVPETPFSMPE